MYGLVNLAIEELVRSTVGDQGWAATCRSAGLDVDFFESMTVYDDDLTFALLDAAAEVIGISSSEFKQQFGQYWIIYTNADGWGPILDSQGSTVREVLTNLNVMHMRVANVMPAVKLPRFEVQGLNPHEFELTYKSERNGLAPMVLGMLRGLTDRFGEAWHIEYIEPAGPAGRVGPAGPARIAEPGGPGKTGATDQRFIFRSAQVLCPTGIAS